MLHNETERLKAVDKFLKLKISRESELTDIARYAAEICYTPMAFISLLGKDTQHILFSVGSDLKQISRENALCNYTIMQDEVMVIPDTAKDERYVNSSQRDIKGANIQFYAGAPLITKDGFNLGSLCVTAHEPKDLSEIQRKMLAVLSRQVIHILDFDVSLALLNQQYLEAKKSEIKLSSFFESSVSCHLLIGKDLEVLAFNKTLADIMRINHGLEMQIGNSVIDYIDDVFFPEFLTNFKEALLGKHIQNESPMITGGKKIWWNYNYVPALDAEGEIIGVSYNAINISDLKLKEQQSNAKDESLKAIAFIQAHEIRRPVSSIMGLMNIFKADDYQSSKEGLIMMERAVIELDEKIRLIVNHTHIDKEE
ncbi:MAG TPA: GAF domain-containing protein [Pedobacter sp.]